MCYLVCSFTSARLLAVIGQLRQDCMKRLGAAACFIKGVLGRLAAVFPHKRRMEI